ncbi:Lrp/AsnC family transcriptional regulator [Paracoccus sp. (in: a-proteobacteria)]|uniref:Lrp/AsnC family transcriptional regulator n=1 Tax=Paracoccus sp. TaxID=267 RepID=UPI0028A101B1|nr:Lrp/AsnC family transcriptional regulator [Paracoccus sp. (in: a-proteobacteria)]
MSQSPRKIGDSRRRTADQSAFDDLDRQILDLLQEKDRPVAVLAEEVGLSQTPCWRRIRKLEEAGVIRGRVTLVDPRNAGVPMTVFIGVTAPRHEMAWLVNFRELIDSIPEIVEAYRLTGSVDYILKVLVPDIETFDHVYKSMIERLEFSQINSMISMEEMKFTTSVPTKYL